MALTDYVVDPDGEGNCYGKYQTHDLPPNIPDEEIVEVDNLDDNTVIEWRYEDRPAGPPLSKRVENLEAASGVGSKGPKKGIAHRIDDLEERIEALEDGPWR